MFRALIFSLLILLSFSEVKAQSGYFRRLQVTDSIYDANRISADSIYLRGSHITQPDTSKILMKDQSDTISANQVFTANQDFNGFIKMGQDNTYVKVKILKFVVATNTWIYTNHGLDWRNVLFQSLVIKHDTTSSFYYDKQIFNLGYNASAIYSTGLLCKIDSLRIGYWISSASTGIVGDTGIVTIFYTNYH